MTSVPTHTLILFLATVAVVSALIPLGVYRVTGNFRSSLLATAGMLTWLAVSGGLAASGTLSFGSRPPTMLIFLPLATALTFFVAYGRIGSLLLRLAPAWLIGFQVFRVPVELFLAQMYHAGILPVQMTYEGMNFDILSGLTALPIAWLHQRGKLPKVALLVWNLVCLGLLITIVSVAILSAPVPFRMFLNPPANTVVTGFPFIWLPAILVQAALFGHLLVFRYLRQSN